MHQSIGPPVRTKFALRQRPSLLDQVAKVDKMLSLSLSLSLSMNVPGYLARERKKQICNNHYLLLHEASILTRAAVLGT
jgi:hypothetical protein